MIERRAEHHAEHWMRESLVPDVSFILGGLIVASAIVLSIVNAFPGGTP